MCVANSHGSLSLRIFASLKKVSVPDSPVSTRASFVVERQTRGAPALGERMNKSRLETFSDGVLAIIITIMVLELRIPEGGNSKHCVR